jgi:hypothetical protein
VVSLITIETLASKAESGDAGSGVATTINRMRVDHEPAQTVENMQREERMSRNKRIFSDGSN